MPEFTIFTFGRFSICCDEREITPLPRHGDTLCQMLLCQPGRRASYSWLIDQIWPLSEGDRANEYLYAAATNFRTATSTDLLLTNRQTQSYELAGQDRLWIDADAALSLITQADTLGRATAEALPLLEQAVQYFRRGRFLAGIEETWVQARRMHLEMMKERALVRLTEAYGQQGQHVQAQTLLSEALAQDPTNENLLCHLMQTLHEGGMTHQALRAYDTFVKALKKAGLEPAEATTSLYRRLKRAPRVLDLSALPMSTPLSLPSSSLAEQHQEHASQARETTEPLLISAGAQEVQTTLLPLFSSAVARGILQAAGEREGVTMDQLRRQMLQHTLGITSAALVTPASAWLHTEMIERLARAPRFCPALDGAVECPAR